jgi:hypothetical protein
MSESGSPHDPSTYRPPSISSTSLGYEFVRCRARDRDDYLYLHYLTACLDHDPHEVFADFTVVARHISIPWLNLPSNLSVVPQSEVPIDPLPPAEVLD